MKTGIHIKIRQRTSYIYDPESRRHRNTSDKNPSSNRDLCSSSWEPMDRNQIEKERKVKEDGGGRGRGQGRNPDSKAIFVILGRNLLQRWCSNYTWVRDGNLARPRQRSPTWLPTGTRYPLKIYLIKTTGARWSLSKRKPSFIREHTCCETWGLVLARVFGVWYQVICYYSMRLIQVPGR